MTPATATAPVQSRSWWRLSMLAVLAVGCIIALICNPLLIRGDGWEYFQTLVSFHEHGTPDFRPGDGTAALAVYPEDHKGRKLQFTPGEPPGWVPSKTGRIYTLHFWAYPLSALPAKAFLRLVGGNEWAALQVANLFWLILGLVGILFFSRRPMGQRWAFALLSASPPVMAYVWYSGTEIYSWSLLTMALVALGNGRYGYAGLFVGLSALQNPASLALGGLPFLVSLRHRQWWSAFRCAVGGSVGLVPFAFCYWHYGRFSLVTAEYTDPANISWARASSLLFDLNQGLLAHFPILMLASAIALIVALIRREWLALGVVVFTLPTFEAMQIQSNWNSDSFGVMRYWVWMIPALAWLVASTFRGRIRWAIALLSVAIHGGLLVLEPPDAGYVHQRILAEWVLTHVPEWYNPDPEIFAERQHGADGYDSRTGYELPVAFHLPDGTVTKLLVDRASRLKVFEEFEVDPAYRPVFLGHTEQEKPVYVHPPPGAIRTKSTNRK